MNVSSNATDLLVPVGIIEPTAAANTFTTDWVEAGKANAFYALIQAGTVGTSVDAKIEQASDSSGTGAKDLSGAAITQLVAAGSAAIQFKPGDLDFANDFDHVRLSITTVGASTCASGSLLSVCHRNAPETDDAKIDEVVTA